MLKLHHAIFIFCSFAFLVFADIEMSLSGTVKDSDGAAIADAFVALLSDSTINDTTNALGEFIIGNTAAKHPNGVSAGLAHNQVSIKNRQIQLTITSPVKSGSVCLFSVDGKMHEIVPHGKIESGSHMFNLGKLAAGFYIMQISLDQASVASRLINSGTEFFISNSFPQKKKFSGIWLNAAVEDEDTLVVKKEGFKVTKKGISSYRQTGISIVMEKEEEGPVYSYAATVENTCADCEVPELPESSTLTVRNSKLPNPFLNIDGTEITRKSHWRCRRQQILKQAMKYIYGEKPEPPELVSGTVTNTKVTVHVEDKGKEIDFSATIKLPEKGQAPYPAIINMGSFGMTIGEKRVTDQGVAIINFDYGRIGKEQQPEGNVDRNRDFQGLFYDLYGGKHSAGLLMAWAWGVSRMIDVLQKSGNEIIDCGRLGVTGCSRMGKAAFAAGLFDERIALILSHETSVGAVPAYRIADAKCPENTDNNFRGQLWLSNNFKSFVKNTSLLPIDAHSLIATIAPRGIYMMENQAQAQMCAQGGNMAALAGAEVYKALGCPQNISYNSNTPNGTGHCTYAENFTDLLIKNIAKFLNHEPAETGDFVAGPGTLNRAEWIDWTAPTLENDTDIYETD
jgi:hypothetical protein